MAKKPSKTFTVYRNTTTGRLENKATANRKPKSQIVKESMPKRGYGDTGRSKK